MYWYMSINELLQLAIISRRLMFENWLFSYGGVSVMIYRMNS